MLYCDVSFVVCLCDRLEQTECSRLGVHQLRRFLEALLQVRGHHPWQVSAKKAGQFKDLPQQQQHLYLRRCGLAHVSKWHARCVWARCLAHDV